MRIRCIQNGVPFFYKQASAPKSGQKATLDGLKIQDFPTPRPV